MFNRKQVIVIVATLALFALLALTPPWRYLDGGFAGFHTVFAPPDSLPDSLVTDSVAVEHVPIRIVPLAMGEYDRGTEFTDEQRRLPYVDVRKMLTASTILFLLAVIGVFALDDRTPRRLGTRSGVERSDRGRDSTG
ncbi:MAG: hypothetical protein MAG453_00607 [Calditrichaeota bacterium]|nr:hypothetical protein [Calditrichota bacterium]